MGHTVTMLLISLELEYKYIALCKALVSLGPVRGKIEIVILFQKFIQRLEMLVS